MTSADFSGSARIARDDQQRAAEAHTSLVVDRMEVALPGGGRRADIGPAERPAWLTAIFERHNAAIAIDTKGCEHVADGIAGPRCIAAWHPGVIVCVQCMADGVLMPEKGSDDEFTCDGCSTVHREGVRATVVRVAADTMFVLGVCVDCAPDLDRWMP